MSINIEAKIVVSVDSRVAFFQREVLTYWDKNGRKNLPWRLTVDPWKILLAEILLRKATSNQAVEVFITVAPGSFSPPPKVQSSLLALKRMPAPLHPGAAEEPYRAFLRAAPAALGASYDELDIPRNARAEELASDAFFRLFEKLRA